MLWKNSAEGQLASIRVFISSTFRDMGGERDVLARHVFPLLRQNSESHGLPLSEIDLRWGITSEEAAEGKVIELCLAEIDQCRPLFFCMLGNRYGWVDPQAAERLARFPHLLRFADRSVTELEIRHGAFGLDGISRSNCYFYFRDASYLDRLPDGADPPDFASESPRHRELLNALKHDIRSSGFTVRDYGDLGSFRDLVQADLQAAITPVLHTDANAADKANQQAFATAHAAAYVEPGEVRSWIDRDRGQRRPIVLVGGPGSGKSAALAHWLRTQDESSRPTLSFWRRLLAGRARTARAPAIICHFLQVDADSEDWLRVVQVLLADLKQFLGQRDEVATLPERAIKQFHSWLALAAAERPVVLVIDGLDRAYPRGGRALLDWLPAPLPKGVDVIVSAREGAVLDGLIERGCAPHSLAGLAVDEVKNLIGTYLGIFGKRLSGELLRTIALSPQAANPLFARTIADELRQFGSHERLEQYLREYLACRDTTALFARLLRRLDEDFVLGVDARACDALALIAASRAGLAESDILVLSGTDGKPVPPRHWAEIRSAIDHHLIDRRGRVDIGPTDLREAVIAARLANEQEWTRVRRQIVDYLAAKEPNPHVVRELPWQLSVLGEWDRLATTLADPRYLSLGWRHYPRDLVAYWRELQHRGHDIAAAYAVPLAEPLQDEAVSRDLCQLLVELGRRDLARPLATTLVTHGSGDGRVRLAWLSLLGGILVDDRDFEAALPVLGRLRSEARQAGDKTILSVCLGDLALCANRLGNPAGALVYHAEEESQCRSAGDMVGLGECLGNFALDLLAAGQANEALARWGEQEQIARRWNQDAMLCLSLRGQARALIALRDISRVFGLLEEAGAHHREAGEVRELRQCRLLTAEARAVGGDADEAFRLCQELESEAAAADDLEGVVEARIAVGRLFLALNRPGAAARMAGLAARTAASIGDLDIRARFLVAACAIASQAKPLS